MLSAFTPQAIIELKQRDKSKIESILAYGDKILVGLNSGSLRIYRVNASGGETHAKDGAKQDAETSVPAPSVDLMREVEKFSRRAIEQLAIIKEASLLVSLSDGFVSIHDLQSYELQEQLIRTKGAGAFAATSNIVKDPTTGIPSIVSRIAVAAKRKLLVWSWHDAELSNDTADITLTAPAKSLTWASGTKIVCGLNSGYVMVDVEKKDTSDILDVGPSGAATGQDSVRFGSVGASGMGYMGMASWVPKPLATRLRDGELLLAKDINTLFIDSDGNALDRRQIPWATAPEIISFSYPFLLALQPSSKGVLEVRNPDSRSLLQSIPLQNATQLHVPQPNISLAHAGKGFLVASERCIWRMNAEDYGSQIDQLVQGQNFDEAISLLGMLEDTLILDKEFRLREVKMAKAQLLFDMRRYEASLDLFTEASAPPSRVIRLFPPAIAGEISIQKAQDEPQAVLAQDDKEITVDSKLSEDKLPESSTDGAKSKKDDPDSESLQGTVVSDKGTTAESVSSQQKPSGNPATDGLLEGKDLQHAVSHLRSFLADSRRRMQRYLNPDGTLKEHASRGTSWQTENSDLAIKSLLPDQASLDGDIAKGLAETAKLIDTTLFKAYMLNSPSLAGSLFRIPNFCDPEVVNEKLLETGRFGELVDFFHGKRLHRPALELLKKFGTAGEASEGPPALRGPKRTVAYLQSLPPELIDTTLDFAEWPIRQDPEVGMEVFLADTENAETLPRDKVLGFLKKIDTALVIQYLEHLVNELNDLTPEYHQLLASLYMGRLKGENETPQEIKADQGDSRRRDRFKEKLLSFLKSSRQYSTAKVLNAIPRDDVDFFEARAIVLSKMGQHKQALEIYVFRLHDPSKAEEYCNSVFLSQISEATSQSTKGRPAIAAIDQDARPSIYHTLLSLYLAPSAPHKPDWEPALDLLSRHGSRLPASSTLDLLPDAFPIKELESYFRGRIRSVNSLMSEDRVVAGLRKTELVNTQAALLMGDGLPGGKGARNRNVVVTEQRVCPICHKRLGRSVISVLPDNSVVHLGCVNQTRKASAGMAGLRGF